MQTRTHRSNHRRTAALTAMFLLTAGSALLGVGSAGAEEFPLPFGGTAGPPAGEPTAAGSTPAGSTPAAADPVVPGATAVAGPVARADATVTTGGTAVEVDVLANDGDPGQVLTLTAVTPPAHGVTTVVAGRVRYQPAAGFTGVDTFGYTATDGAGGVATGTVSVAVANTAPVPVADRVATGYGRAVTVPVLANDTDADGDALVVRAVGSPASGTATLNPDRTVRYTPATGFSGVVTFSYTISDGALAGTASVAVTVGAPPKPRTTTRSAGTGTVTRQRIVAPGGGEPTAAAQQPPQAQDDSARTTSGRAVAVRLLDDDSDPEDDDLSVTALSQPAHGTAQLVDGQTANYTPAKGYVGTDTFTYTVEDEHGAADTGTVTVTVEAAAGTGTDTETGGTGTGSGSGSGETGSGGTGAGGTALPRTGADVVSLTGAGLTALAGGVALVAFGGRPPVLRVAAPGGSRHRRGGGQRRRSGHRRAG